MSVRASVVRAFTYRGRTESFTSLASLFQGLCASLREAGTLPTVYAELAQIKQRILKDGHALSPDDVFVLAEAYVRRSDGADPLSVGAPKFILSVPPIGERMAYHREFVHNMQDGNSTLVLNQEALVEVLAAVLHPRHFSSAEINALLLVDLPQEGLGILRILDTLYKATFSRTIRKELCDPKISLTVPVGEFRLILDQQRTAHVSTTCQSMMRHLLFRLYRSPDLATVLDSDDRMRARIQDGLRLLTGALHDAAILPQKRQEVEAILRERKPADDLEELEEL
jgi:hypothetical protein